LIILITSIVRSGNGRIRKELNIVGKGIKIIFQGKRGVFGEGGWVDVNWFHYIWLWSCSRVIRIRFTWKGITYLIGEYATNDYNDGFITVERKDDE